MCKTKIINNCNKTAENEIDVNEIDTDEYSNDKSRWISLLDKFKDSFIRGFLCNRINTCQLEIRLIDSNITVRASPLELLIGKTARPYGLLLPDDFVEREVDISNITQQAIQNIESNAKYDKGLTELRLK